MASSSWSHSFLTAKNQRSTPTSPPTAHSMKRSTGRLRRLAPLAAAIEDAGQHEVLNWFCLAGAMEALGRKPDKATFIETWAFVSPVVFAYYNA